MKKAQDIRAHDGIHVLEIHPKMMVPIYSVGRITQVGRMRLVAGNSTSAPTNVIDMTVLDGNETKQVTFPIDATHIYLGNVLYSFDMEPIVEGLKDAKSRSELSIASVPTWEKCRDECQKLITQFEGQAAEDTKHPTSEQFDFAKFQAQAEKQMAALTKQAQTELQGQMQGFMAQMQGLLGQVQPAAAAPAQSERGKKPSE